MRRFSSTQLNFREDRPSGSTNFIWQWGPTGPQQIPPGSCGPIGGPTNTILQLDSRHFLDDLQQGVAKQKTLRRAKNTSCYKSPARDDADGRVWTFWIFPRCGVQRSLVPSDLRRASHHRISLERTSARSSAAALGILHQKHLSKAAYHLM